MTVNKITNKAFTIVELIIVVVIIGILAAITIVSYGTMTSRANTTSLISAANTVVTKAEVWKANNGEYPLLMSDMTGALSTNSGYIPSSAASFCDFGAGTTPTSNISTGVTAPISSANCSNPKNAVRYIICGYKNGTSAPTSVADMTVKSGVIGLTWNYTTNARDITSYQGIVDFGSGPGNTSTSYVINGVTYSGTCFTTLT